MQARDAMNVVVFKGNLLYMVEIVVEVVLLQKFVDSTHGPLWITS